MSTIRHYTKPHWIESIIDGGVIELEGHNIRRGTIILGKDSLDYDKLCTEMKGDQVWFTDAKRCNTASKFFSTEWKDCYFEFDTADIPVRKWHHYKKDILKNKPEAQRVITALDKSAKEMGDDSYDYWVSDVPIDISLAKRTGIMSDDFNLESKNAVNPYI